VRKATTWIICLIVSGALAAPDINVMRRSRTAPAASPVFTFVQKNTTVCTQTAEVGSSTCSLDGNTTAGNLIVLGCGCYPGDLTNVTDAGSGTWAQVRAKITQGVLWWKIEGTGGWSQATLTWVANSKSSCRILEFNLSSGTITKDTDTGNTGSSTTPTATAITPAVTSELFVGLSTANNAPTHTNTWTGSTEVGYTGGSGYGTCGMAYKISTGTSAETPSWTIASNSWGVFNVAFKPQ